MSTYLGLSNMVLRNNGVAAKVDVETSDGKIELVIPVAQFPVIIANIARLANEVWAQQGLSGADTQSGFAAEIQASSVLLVQGANGKWNFLFRVGALDLAFPFDPQILAADAEALTAALRAAAATDKARRGSAPPDRKRGPESHT